MRISIVGSVIAEAPSLLWNRNRNPDRNIIPTRFVARGLAVVVDAVRADAVQQATLFESPIQEGFAGVEVVGRLVEVLRSQLAKRLRVGLVVALVRRKREGDVQVAPALFVSVCRLLEFPRRRERDAEEIVAEQFAAGCRRNSDSPKGVLHFLRRREFHFQLFEVRLDLGEEFLPGRPVLSAGRGDETVVPLVRAPQAWAPVDLLQRSLRQLFIVRGW